MVKMIATASAVAFVVYSCKDELGRAKDILIEETPVQTVENMFIVQSKNGVIQMRAEGEIMEKYERDTLSYELFPKGFSVYGYTEDGLLETEIVADQAIHRMYSDGRESWEAFGNVVVKNLIKQEVMESKNYLMGFWINMKVVLIIQLDLLQKQLGLQTQKVEADVSTDIVINITGQE